MHLFFARHGESEANALRVISNRGRQHGLTAQGRDQASALAKAVRGLVSVVYSSPLLRAVETAEIVSAALGLRHKACDALREYDCGVLEGKTDPESWELHAWFAEEWLQGRNLDRMPEGGESFVQIRSRFVPFIDSLMDAHAGSQIGILLIGHGGLYRLMLPVVMNNVDRAFVRERGFPNTAVVVAEGNGKRLTCLEWCGVPMTVNYTRSSKTINS